MNEECSGLQFQSPDGSVHVNKLADMFVDGLNQYYNAPTAGKTLLSQVQYNVQMHSDQAYTTVGCIALDKCNFFTWIITLTKMVTLIYSQKTNCLRA